MEGNNGKLIAHIFMSTIPESRRLRNIYLFVFLTIGYFLADYFPDVLNTEIIQAWYPAAGVAMIFGVLFSWKSALAVFAASILSQFFHGTLESGYLPYIQTILLTLATTILPHYIFKLLRIDLQLVKTRDVNLFLVTSCILAAGVGWIQLFASGNYNGNEYIWRWILGLFFSLQTIIGILTLYPFGILITKKFINLSRKSTRKFSDKDISPSYQSISEFGLVLLIYTVITLLVFQVPVFKTLNSYYLFFIPLIWLSLRFGRFGTGLGVLIVTSGIMTAIRVDHPSIASTLNIQMFLVVQVIVTIFTSHYVSERRKTITSLQVSESQFKAVTDTAPAGIIQIDNEGEICFTNERWSCITGYSQSSSMGIPIRSIVSDEDKQNVVDILEMTMDQNTSMTTQFRLLGKDQNFIWVQCNLSPFMDETGKKLGVLVAIFDISQIKETEEALSSSSLLIRSFIDNLPDPAWLKNLEGKYLAVNQANCNLYGISCENFINKTDEEIWGGEKSRDFSSSDKYVIENKMPVRFEDKAVDKDGDVIWHEVVKSPIIQNNQVIGTTGIARDVTARKRIETALIESEQRLKAILNNIPDLAWLKDTQDRFIAVNEIFCSTYGFEKDRVLGATTLDLFPAKLAEKLLTDDREVITIGRPKVIEEEVTNAEGYASWYETIKMPIFDGKKNIVGITGIAREITSRKRAEESLQHQLTMETIITSVAARLNALNPDAIEAGLISVLQILGEFLKVDRCVLATMDGFSDPSIRDIQWTTKGVERRSLIIKDNRLEDFKWINDCVTNKRTIICSRISDLPLKAGREMEYWLKNRIISLIGLPILSAEKGFRAWITAETVSIEKHWGSDEEQLLKLVGEMIMATIARLDSERKLKLAEHRYRMLAEQIAAVVYIESPEGFGRITYISPQVTELTGYSPDKWIASSLWQKIIHPLDKKRVIRMEKMSLKTCSDFREEYRLITKNGEVIWIEDQMSFMRDEGEKGVWHGVMYDITKQKLIEEELSRSKARYQDLFDHSPISLWEEDFSRVNKRVKILMRKSNKNIRLYIKENPSEVSRLLSLLKVINVNQTTLTLMAKDSFNELSTLSHPTFNLKPIDLFIEEIVAISEGKTNFEVEGANDFRDGIIRYHNLHFMVMPGYEKSYERVIIAITDITDRKITEEKLTYLSTHDSLTGLFSRSFFETELARLQESRQYPISILMVDADNLKITNDTEGHAAGDLLIKRTANVLRMTFRPEDIVARIGGDEFAILIPNSDSHSAVKFIQRLRGMLELENKSNPSLKRLDISIGVATAETGDLLADTLKAADFQMYQDKEHKKARGN